MKTTLTAKILCALLAILMCVSVFACNKAEKVEASDTTTDLPEITTPTLTSLTGLTTLPKETLAPPVTLETTTVGELSYVSYRDNLNFDLTAQIPSDGVITTAAQLQAVLTNGNKNANYTVNAKELDCAGLGWTGLWNYSGTFDFGGCVIKNASSPMFITVQNGTVKNLTIAESKYYYNDKDSELDAPILSSQVARIYYAPVVSYLNGGVVDNVVVESSVLVNTSILIQGSGIGGIVGWASGTNVTISNCTFKGEFYTDSSMGYFGGIVGNFDGKSYSFNQNSPESAGSKIINCTNFGHIVEEDNSNDSKIGGIAGGIVNSAVVRCANYGTVESGNSGQTAGVVGYVNGNSGVVYCLNAGEVKVENRGGGICAYSNGTHRYFYGCVNIGKVTSKNSKAAGLVALAKNAEVFINCYNYSRVIASAIKNVNEKNVGIGDNPSNFEKLTIKNCYSFNDLAKMNEALAASCAGVFVYDESSSSFKIATAKYVN